MSEPSCSIHGTERAIAVHLDARYDPQFARHRCAADTGDGTTCGRIALPPPPRLPWHTRVMLMLPSRPTVERIMCTLIVGFWIGLWIWAELQI